MADMRFWDKQEGGIYPNGKQVTKEEIFEEFPFTALVPHVVFEYLPNGFIGGIDDLDILKNVYGITEEDPQTALDQIIYIREHPPEPEPQADINAFIFGILEGYTNHG